jgi:hypothetical protein
MTSKHVWRIGFRTTVKIAILVLLAASIGPYLVYTVVLADCGGGGGGGEEDPPIPQPPTNELNIIIVGGGTVTVDPFGTNGPERVL